MKNKFSDIVKYSLIWVVLGMWAMGCSQYNTNSGSVAYHNVTAKYNAYFIAKTDLSEAERTIKKEFKDDYNALIPILMPFDSNQAQSAKPLLQDAIKKASLVAERHQNSKWLDNSYTILGKARLYLGQWEDGVEALRYVFAKGKDENDKNTALIWLMRAYIANKDFSNALSVAEYLRQQPLSKEATRDFYLTKAYLHQQNGEYLTSVAILEQTLSLMKKSSDKARLHYAAGQLYDRIGQYALANKQYKQVDGNRPSYDLSFFAQMSSLNNRVLLDPKIDLGKVGFERMLRDRKNSDLKDRIYYTMGLLADRRGKYPEALQYLRQSVASAGANKERIPYTYLELARIYYDRLENYEFAKAYYDSTLMVLPKTTESFKRVSDRQRALSEFVKHLTIIRREDSLQALARLNPLLLEKKLDEMIAAEEKAKELQRERDREAVNAGPSAEEVGTAFISGNGQRWELYDPALINQGKTDFNRIWGNRKLEDNWRRKNRDSKDFGDLASQAGNRGPAGVDNGKTTGNQETAGPDAGMTKDSPLWAKRRDELRADLPMTSQSLDSSQKRKEEALYSLGKIYRFELKEPAKAYTTFNRLLNEFPKTDYREELYYLNYLCLNEGDKDKLTWKNRILEEFPNSTYARLVSKSTSLKEGIAGDNSSPSKVYDRIYGLYAGGNYKEGLSAVEFALSQFHGHELEDKFALLRIFLVGKVRGKEHYLQAANEFIRLYPESLYLSRVKEIFDAASQVSHRN